jgi:AraC-like DNA-binding protein
VHYSRQIKDASNDEMTERLLERKPHQARVNLQHLLNPINMIAQACRFTRAG